MGSIAVVIPTRNRGTQPVEAARAILADPLDFELIVVDQSEDDATAVAFASLHDPRLRVLRSSQEGISSARNLGVSVTSAPIVAFTDDDCRPAPGWVSSLLRVFAQEPDAALVFGRVSLPEGMSDGYAASFEPGQRVLTGGVPLPSVGLGIGANMAIRREALTQLGGFDPLLGIGAPLFRAGEDTDILVRALHAGYSVVNAPECEVLHLGLRRARDKRRLAVGYQTGTGAALGKHARLAGVSGVGTLLRWTAFYLGQSLANIPRQKQVRLGVPWYFLKGALQTFRYRIDRAHGGFESRA